MILICSCEAPLQSIDGKGELTPCCLKVALNRKGLRHQAVTKQYTVFGLKVALNRKGLRLKIIYRRFKCYCLKVARLRLRESV